MVIGLLNSVYPLKCFLLESIGPLSPWQRVFVKQAHVEIRIDRVFLVDLWDLIKIEVVLGGLGILFLNRVAILWTLLLMVIAIVWLPYLARKVWLALLVRWAFIIQWIIKVSLLRLFIWKDVRFRPKVRALFLLVSLWYVMLFDRRGLSL